MLLGPTFECLPACWNQLVCLRILPVCAAGKNAVVTTALVPATGLVVQKAVSQAVPSAGDVPLAVFAPVVGSVVGAVRGLLPF